MRKNSQCIENPTDCSPTEPLPGFISVKANLKVGGKSASSSKKKQRAADDDFEDEEDAADDDEEDDTDDTEDAGRNAKAPRLDLPYLPAARPQRVK